MINAEMVFNLCEFTRTHVIRCSLAGGVGVLFCSLCKREPHVVSNHTASLENQSKRGHKSKSGVNVRANKTWKLSPLLQCHAAYNLIRVNRKFAAVKGKTADTCHMAP